MTDLHGAFTTDRQPAGAALLFATLLRPLPPAAAAVALPPVIWVPFLIVLLLPICPEGFTAAAAAASTAALCSVTAGDTDDSGAYDPLNGTFAQFGKHCCLGSTPT